MLDPKHVYEVREVVILVDHALVTPARGVPASEFTPQRLSNAFTRAWVRLHAFDRGPVAAIAVRRVGRYQPSSACSTPERVELICACAARFGRRPINAVAPAAARTTLPAAIAQ
jgi:hypothetical protein